MQIFNAFVLVCVVVTLAKNHVTYRATFQSTDAAAAGVTGYFELKLKSGVAVYSVDLKTRQYTRFPIESLAYHLHSVIHTI